LSSDSYLADPVHNDITRARQALQTALGSELDEPLVLEAMSSTTLSIGEKSDVNMGSLFENVGNAFRLELMDRHAEAIEKLDEMRDEQERLGILIHQMSDEKDQLENTKRLKMELDQKAEMLRLKEEEILARENVCQDRMCNIEKATQDLERVQTMELELENKMKTLENEKVKLEDEREELVAKMIYVQENLPKAEDIEKREHQVELGKKSFEECRREFQAEKEKWAQDSAQKEHLLDLEKSALAQRAGKVSLQEVDIEQREKRLVGLEDERKTVTNSMEHISAETSRIREMQNDLERRLSELSKREEVSKRRVADAEAIHHELEARLEALRLREEQCTEKEEALNEKQDEVDQSIKELESERIKVKHSKDTLRLDQHRWRSSMSTEKSKLEERRCDIVRSLQEVEIKKQEILELEAQLEVRENTMRGLQSLQVQVREEQFKLEMARSDFERRKERFDEDNRIFKQEKGTIEELTSQLSTLKQQFSNASSELEKMHAFDRNEEIAKERLKRVELKEKHVAKEETALAIRIMDIDAIKKQCEIDMANAAKEIKSALRARRSHEDGLANSRQAEQTYLRKLDELNLHTEKISDAELKMKQVLDREKRVASMEKEWRKRFVDLEARATKLRDQEHKQRIAESNVENKRLIVDAEKKAMRSEQLRLDERNMEIDKICEDLQLKRGQIEKETHELDDKLNKLRILEQELGKKADEITGREVKVDASKEKLKQQQVFIRKWRIEQDEMQTIATKTLRELQQERDQVVRLRKRLQGHINEKPERDREGPTLPDAQRKAAELSVKWETVLSEERNLKLELEKLALRERSLLEKHQDLSKREEEIRLSKKSTENELATKMADLEVRERKAHEEVDKFNRYKLAVKSELQEAADTIKRRAKELEHEQRTVEELRLKLEKKKSSNLVYERRLKTMMESRERQLQEKETQLVKFESRLKFAEQRLQQRGEAQATEKKSNLKAASALAKRLEEYGKELESRIRTPSNSSNSTVHPSKEVKELVKELQQARREQDRSWKQEIDIVNKTQEEMEKRLLEETRIMSERQQIEMTRLQESMRLLQKRDQDLNIEQMKSMIDRANSVVAGKGQDEEYRKDELEDERKRMQAELEAERKELESRQEHERLSLMLERKEMQQHIQQELEKIQKEREDALRRDEELVGHINESVVVSEDSSSKKLSTEDIDLKKMLDKAVRELQAEKDAFRTELETYRKQQQDDKEALEKERKEIVEDLNARREEMKVKLLEEQRALEGEWEKIKHHSPPTKQALTSTQQHISPPSVAPPVKELQTMTPLLVERARAARERLAKEIVQKETMGPSVFNQDQEDVKITEGGEEGEDEEEDEEEGGGDGCVESVPEEHRSSGSVLVEPPSNTDDVDESNSDQQRLDDRKQLIYTQKSKLETYDFQVQTTVKATESSMQRLERLCRLLVPLHAEDITRDLGASLLELTKIAMQTQATIHKYKLGMDSDPLDDTVLDDIQRSVQEISHKQASTEERFQHLISQAHSLISMGVQHENMLKPQEMTFKHELTEVHYDDPSSFQDNMEECLQNLEKSLKTRDALLKLDRELTPSYVSGDFSKVQHLSGDENDAVSSKSPVHVPRSPAADTDPPLSMGTEGSEKDEEIMESCSELEDPTLSNENRVLNLRLQELSLGIALADPDEDAEKLKRLHAEFEEIQARLFSK